MGSFSKDFIQYNGLFLSSSIPVQKQLVILRSHIIIKGLGYIHDLASHKSRFAEIFIPRHAFIIAQEF